MLAPSRKPFSSRPIEDRALRSFVAATVGIVIALAVAGGIHLLTGCEGGAPVAAKVIENVAPSATEPSAPVPTVSSQAAPVPTPAKH